MSAIYGWQTSCCCGRVPERWRAVVAGSRARARGSQYAKLYEAIQPFLTETPRNQPEPVDFD